MKVCAIAVRMWVQVCCVAALPLAPCSAQGVEVTINSQGAQALKDNTGQLIKGVRLLDALICPDPGTAQFSGGRIWQAAIAHGVSPQIPEQARITLNRRVTFNWRNWLITFVATGSGGMLALASGNIVAASAKILTALAVGHVFWDQFGPVLKSQLPDPSGFLQSLLDPSKPIVFEVAGNCITASMVAQFNPSLPVVIGPFRVGSSNLDRPIIILPPGTTNSTPFSFRDLRKGIAGEPGGARFEVLPHSAPAGAPQ